MPDLVVSSLGVASAATNAYCTRGELKAELQISDTANDTLIDLSINAASRQIDGHCGWRFWQDTAVQTRTFTAESSGGLYLLDDDLGEGIATTTGLIVKTDGGGDGTYETTLTVDTDFTLGPANAQARTPAWPYTELLIAPLGSVSFPTGWGRPSVQITAKFGWPAVPDDVTKACLIQAAQLFKAKDTPFGVAGVGDLGVLRIRSGMNPIAQGLLAPYRKPAIG